MEVIGDHTISNGLEPDEDCIETKPVITKHGIVEDSNSARVTSSGLALRVPVENLHNTGAVSYRLLPLKVDSTMESLSEGESTVPIAPLLATQISSESNEPRLALISSSETTAEPNQTVVVSGGQFYLISESTNNTSSGNRTTFIPRSSETILNQRMSSSREEKRRVTHNEVERRRRDKINNWICRLAKVLPECSDMQSKTSQVSKGVILAKACDYIDDLKKQIRHLTDRVTLAEMKQNSDDLKREIDILKRENNALKNDNALLKAQIHQQGLLDDHMGS